MDVEGEGVKGRPLQRVADQVAGQDRHSRGGGLFGQQCLGGISQHGLDRLGCVGFFGRRF
jgi:hypothetical protein